MPPPLQKMRRHAQCINHLLLLNLYQTHSPARKKMFHPTRKATIDLQAEELYRLDSFGVLKESMKLIAAHSRLFTKFSAVFILPLSLLILAQIRITSLLLDAGFSVFDETLLGLPSLSGDASLKYRILSPDWALFFLFNAIYLLSLLAFALLSTSAIVHSVASISAVNDLSFFFFFTTVVPKVWKRLMHTFLTALLHLLPYSLAFALVISSAFLLVDDDIGFIIVTFPLRLAYLICYMVICVVWQLASVVSVLEDACEAAVSMRRSRELIRGKSEPALQILYLLLLGFLMLEKAFKNLVVEGSGCYELRVVLGLAILVVLVLVLVLLILLGLVAQTVFYFVCKSYRRQRDSNSAVGNQLELYCGNLEPLQEILFYFCII